MSFPPLPQFSEIYEGTKLRYLVQILETSFRDLGRLTALLNNIPYVQTFATTTGNVSTGETTLFTANIPTNNISGPTWEIYINAFGTFASNSNTKELILYLNDVAIYDSTGVTVSGGNWNIDATIVWNSAATQKNMVTTNSSNATFPATAHYSATTAAFDSPISVTLTGTGGATNDIVGQVMIVTTQLNLT